MKRKRTPGGALIIVAGVLLALQSYFPAVAAFGFNWPAPQHGFSLRWTADPSNPNRASVEVLGLDSRTLRLLRAANWDEIRWRQLLSVYVNSDSSTVANASSTLPPVVGSYSIEGTVLRFAPRFPLDPAVGYAAVFKPNKLPGRRNPIERPLSAAFRLPQRISTPTTVVTQVYPSSDILPENLLKFYVYFSAPMSRGRIYDYIHLRNEAGKDVELPFLEIDEELWDPPMMRLTLLIDPGRIKRGVLPLEEIGPALEEGKQYVLAIDRDWRDGAGQPLKESFQKTFKVGPPDRRPIDPVLWKITPPTAGSREPLVAFFQKPLDHALAQRVIRVADAAGALIEGKIALEDQERRWTFTPVAAWRSASYKLVIQTTLEDLAGNNIGKPFDVDLFEGIQRRITTSAVELKFDVR